MKFEVRFVFPDKCKDEFELVMDGAQETIYDLVAEKLYTGVFGGTYYCLDDESMSAHHIEIEFGDEQIQEMLHFFIFGRADGDISFDEALQTSFISAVLDVMTHYNMCNYISTMEKEFIDQCINNEIIRVMV